MLLRVEQQTGAVDVAIEVDGELRDAGDRFGDVDECRRAVDAHDASRHAEVAVEPAVVQDAAVHLDAELPPTGTTGVGARFHPQAGRVGVGADESERSMWAGIGPGESPRDERCTAHDVSGSGYVVPGVGLVEALEADQAVDRRGDGVPR